MNARSIQVLVIDDSALVRQILAQAIARAPGIELMATAADPLFAMDKMRRSWPDVIILDIEMPRMDGLAFLRKLRAERPTPVIICSSLAESGSGTLMQALAAGAVSVVSKPKSGLKNFLEDATSDIIAAVRSAAGARVRLLVQPGAAALPLARHPDGAVVEAHLRMGDISLGVSQQQAHLKAEGPGQPIERRLGITIDDSGTEGGLAHDGLPELCSCFRNRSTFP